MSSYFLRRFAQQLLTDFPEDLSRVTIVLPTSRARLFLMRHLHELKGGAFWAPRCIILPEWIRSILPGRIGGELEMIAAMFEQYRDVVKGSDAFDVFLGWQGVALRDFNDVDAALAPAKRVFSDLRNIREIEQWDVEGWSYDRTPLSTTQQDFLRFWMQLGELYQAFSSWQDENSCWTYSRAVRHLAEHPDAMVMDEIPACIYFVGLGSYSAAERKLIRSAGEVMDVRMIWDLDSYYYDNPLHEAGRHARRWKDSINSDEVTSKLTQHAMRATIIQCGTSISQVIRAAEILAQFSEEELENTCVVINDESALEPLLSAITDVKSDVNLAIGKPIQQTHLSRIVEELFVLRSLHVRKGKMYYKPFVQWLQIIRAAGFYSQACEEIRDQIVSRNSVQITQDHIQEWQNKYSGLSDLLGALLVECAPDKAVSQLFDFIESVTPMDDFMKAARSKMMGVLEELLALLEQTEYMRDDHLLLKIYQLVIGRMKLHYEGEPVNGLQLLSISETRALDFDRVLFLGSNDEYFPGERMEQSFIPFDLRAHYQLPMPEDLDAMHSYTYYRLLHEARDVYYLYSAIVSDSKPGEPSRYITQYLSEISQANRSIEIIQEVVGNSEPLNFKEGVISSDFIRERVKALFASGVSPSAINKLISCPLDFYYLYIARLGEEEEVEETLSSSTFGQIVHKVLEDFYKPFIDSYPDEQAFADLKNNLETIVFDAARELYKGRTISEGIDYLSMRIAIEMLEKYIGFELQTLRSDTSTTFQRRVALVEGAMNKAYPEGVGGLPVPFAVKGKIDRGDSVAGVLQVIDYKTGKISSGKAKFKGNFDDLFKKKEFSKFLQLLVYIMMTRQRDRPIPTASFYSMREGGGAFVHAQELSELTIDHDFIDNVEEALGRFLHDLLNREKFEHSSDAKYCQYCFVK